MARYLTPEWVQAFDRALAGLDLTEAIAAAGAASLTASLGAFAVAQVVTGVPGEAEPDAVGDTVRTVLTVGEGRVSLVSDPDGTRPANVTIVLAYPDALAMAAGELDPADALANGRVRVRGELAVLVAGQSVLAAAARQLGPDLAALSE
ncbi:MAG TPA: SCP2 sterol-binding domain-containing protein [Acidimicrobiales bacterium]|jgi:hypothetical protein|nr:SCP2 sterol-binding domain-containing protein [Acidimicrobiales bacterium]